VWLTIIRVGAVGLDGQRAAERGTMMKNNRWRVRRQSRSPQMNFARPFVLIWEMLPSGARGACQGTAKNNLVIDSTTLTWGGTL
jgi:hypothetical protein